MKLADEICLKLYGSTSTKPEQGFADAVLQRAIQACHQVADQCGEETNKQTARACAFAVEKLCQEAGNETGG